MDNPFKKLSKTEIYVVIGGGVAIAGFAEYRHYKATGSWSPFATGSTPNGAASGTAQSGTDPITGLPYSDDNATDPLTSETYLAEADQYGTVAAAEAAVSAYGQSTASGSGIPVNPASPASSGSINTVVGTSVYTSNAAWASAATAGLTDVGYDGPTVATALGAYLTQTPLTADQVTIVNTAIAEYGPAPVGSLQVIRAPIAKPAPPPVVKPTVETVKVPNFDLMSLAEAQGRIQAAGLTFDGPRGEPGTTKVNGQQPPAGKEVPKGTKVVLRTKLGKGK